jgi:hypothetical protein
VKTVLHSSAHTNYKADPVLLIVDVSNEEVHVELELLVGMRDCTLVVSWCECTWCCSLSI